MTDWNKIKFRASSWGNLLAESKTKGELIGRTCAAELIKIYNQEVFGRKRDIVTAQMDKGKQAEPDSIALFSMLEGKLYMKNEEELENDWFRGHPDIFTGEDIYHAEECNDIKSSWDLDTFCPKLVEEPDKGYIAQLNCYYSLTGAKYGHLVYCLVDCPPNILEAEKRKLLYSMNVISEESPEFKKAAQELEHLLTFKDISPELRCIKIPIPRDEELIQKMKDKVPVLRGWLHDFHKKHQSQYKKELI